MKVLDYLYKVVERLESFTIDFEEDETSTIFLEDLVSNNVVFDSYIPNEKDNDSLFRIVFKKTGIIVNFNLEGYTITQEDTNDLEGFINLGNIIKREEGLDENFKIGIIEI